MTQEPRVLFWIRRRAAPRGGDLIALEHTVAALRARGVACDVSADTAQNLTDYTLVHLYNLADANAAVEYVARALDANKPLVATPIYWTHQQWLDVRAHATPATHPEFFPGSLTPDQRALSERVLLQTETLARAAHQLVCDTAARIFVLSQGEGELLESEFHAAREKMRVTYNGLDPAFRKGNAERFFQTYGLRDFVFSAARIEERKNTIGVIRAWRDETIPLVFAGQAPDDAYLELCKREATPNIHFLGLLGPDTVADAYAAARVHVLASWWEEASLSALEAGLAGCNLVMTQNGSAREYCGETCFLCDPAEPRTIHDAIRAAYDAPRHTDLASRLSQEFTWDRTAQTLHETYAEIAAQPEIYLPRVHGDAWKQVSEPLAELLYLREEYLTTLEAHAHEQAAWAQELERIVATHDAERKRQLNLPFARTLQKRWRAP